MSIKRFDAKRDANEPEIFKGLIQAGCSVQRSDWVDLVVGHNGRTFLLEVKTSWKAPLKDSQKLLLEMWKGHYVIVTNLDEALQAVNIK